MIWNQHITKREPLAFVMLQFTRHLVILPPVKDVRFLTISLTDYSQWQVSRITVNHARMNFKLHVGSPVFQPQNHRCLRLATAGLDKNAAFPSAAAYAQRIMERDEVIV